MIQLTPQMKVLVAVEPVDFRRGIDGLAAVCREKLGEDAFSGTVFIFRSRSGVSVKVLVYDGQGFWLAQKRLSEGRFRWWPGGKGKAEELAAHAAQVLLAAGNPAVESAGEWRRVRK